MRLWACDSTRGYAKHEVFPCCKRLIVIASRTIEISTFYLKWVLQRIDKNSRTNCRRIAFREGTVSHGTMWKTVHSSLFSRNTCIDCRLPVKPCSDDIKSRRCMAFPRSLSSFPVIQNIHGTCIPLWDENLITRWIGKPIIQHVFESYNRTQPFPNSYDDATWPFLKHLVDWLERVCRCLLSAVSRKFLDARSMYSVGRSVYDFFAQLAIRDGNFWILQPSSVVACYRWQYWLDRGNF